MGFRNDREALDAKVRAQEQEIEELRAEVEELRAAEAASEAEESHGKAQKPVAHGSPETAGIGDLRRSVESGRVKSPWHFWMFLVVIVVVVIARCSANDCEIFGIWHLRDSGFKRYIESQR